jgi:very-short-patch-repair endonuclease
VDSEVLRIAATQRGNLTRGQARATGVSRDAIRRALDDGRWREPFAGVYFIGAGEIGPLAHAHAALLASPRDSALSHRTGGAVHRALDVWPAQPDVTSPDRNRRAPDGIVLHRVRELPPHHVTVRHGLRVTTPERTLLDLAEVLDEDALARALGEAKFRGVVDDRRLAAVMRECRGRRGLKLLRDVVGDGAQPTASELEDRFLKLLRKAELPIPATNERLGRYRPDFLWPQQKVIVETDGWAGHRGRFEADRARDADLLVMGYRIMRVTARRLRTAPYAVVARLGALLLTS